jgi:hypothetical protein
MRSLLVTGAQRRLPVPAILPPLPSRRLAEALPDLPMPFQAGTNDLPPARCAPMSTSPPSGDRRAPRPCSFPHLNTGSSISGAGPGIKGSAIEAERRKPQAPRVPRLRRFKVEHGPAVFFIKARRPANSSYWVYGRESNHIGNRRGVRSYRAIATAASSKQGTAVRFKLRREVH